MDERTRLAVERAVGVRATATWQHVHASGWADAWRLVVGERRLFVKVTGVDRVAMLEAEADGLRAIKATATIRVPAAVAVGSEEACGYLAVEWLDLSGPGDDAALGAALARLHRAKPLAGPRGERFGWSRDNFLGATPQANGWCDDWAAFFAERRLAPQLARAAANGHGADLQRRGERLLQRSRELLRRRDVEPSLVHGDLWSGNAGSLADGTPVVFDPAVYVGDREVDIAMTELFGGFGGAFMRAYGEAWPLDSGYPQRRAIYNLYHLLNHLNLFGSSYATRVDGSIDAILAAR
jgi:fructosamine-3-kinase